VLLGLVRKPEVGVAGWLGLGLWNGRVGEPVGEAAVLNRPARNDRRREWFVGSGSSGVGRRERVDGKGLTVEMNTFRRHRKKGMTKPVVLGGPRSVSASGNTGAEAAPPNG
ncbi:hypothetical protein, partial [Frankia nepalensis]